MPKLGERKEKVPTVPTYVQLPVTAREQLEAAINHTTIRSLTEAIVAAAALLTPDKKGRKR